MKVRILISLMLFLIISGLFISCTSPESPSQIRKEQLEKPQSEK